MTTYYPVNYPYSIDSDEQWPETVYGQPYPSEYNYNRNPYESNSPIDETFPYTPQFNNDHRHHRSDANHTSALAIRRHTPGSTDPTLQQLSPSPSPSRTPKARMTYKQKPVYHVPAQTHSPVTLDGDERPIRPMKNTSVYTEPSSPRRIIQSKKGLSRHKPVYTPPVSPHRYDSDSFQAPPSRSRINTVSSRRPIRTDLIPKTPFGIASQRNRSRQVIVEEEYDDYPPEEYDDYTPEEYDDYPPEEYDDYPPEEYDDYAPVEYVYYPPEEYDDYPPVEYVHSTPKRIIAYQQVRGMTTREMENYQMLKARRVVHGQTPPIRTVIYRK